MVSISQKWSMSRIPDNWIFTKSHANGIYKRVVSESKTKSSPGAPQEYRRKRIGGEWYYWVSAFYGNRDRFAFTKDLWHVHGFKVHGTPDGDIYVRRK
jgi:hypothetical protein